MNGSVPTHSASQPTHPALGWGLRRFRRAALALLFVGLVLPMSASPQPNGRPPAPQRDAAPLRPDNADTERREEFRRGAEQSLQVQERVQKRALRNAETLLQAGKTVDGLRLLQRLLDLNEDRFTWTGNSTEPTGLRRRATAILDGLDAESLDTYERLFGVHAERLVENALKTGNTQNLRTALRRFGHTRAGFEAGQLLAAIAVDRGDRAQAIALWERLRAVPQHRKRVTSAMLLQLASAYRRTGRVRKAEMLVRELGSARLRIGGRFTTARAYLDKLPVMPPRDADWRLPAGDSANNRFAAMSTPYPLPVWTREFSAPAKSSLIQSAETWQQERRARGRSSATVNAPLVVGRTVILRDFAGVRGLDLATGKPLWSCEAAFAPYGRMAFSFAHAFAGNSLAGSLSSDGRRAFFVDALRTSHPEAIRERAPFLAPGRRELSLQRIDGSNRLNAVAIGGGPSHKAGDIVWTIGGKPALGKPATLAGHFFLGPPLPALGRLYVLSEHDRRIHLHCLRPDDGRVEWSQPLAVPELSVASDAYRMFRSATPALAGGLVICPTHCGFLVAVDALTGTLRWAAFCGDSLEELQRQQMLAQSRHAKGHTGFRSPPVVHNGRVVYLPPHADNLFCLDARTGRRLWTAARDSGEYVGCVDDDSVLLVGARTVRALAFSDGRARWTTAVDTPSGRGLATRDRYLLPVESGRVLTLDRRTGRLIGFGIPGLIGSKSPDSDWRPGNLIPAGTMILSAEPTGLRAFPSAASALGGVERRMRARRTLTDVRQASELSLLLGRSQSADRLLTEALRQTGADAELKALRRLLRELLFARLRARDGDPAKLLARLDRLAKEAHDRGRYLMEKAEYDLQRRNAAALLGSLDELAALESNSLFTAPGSDAYLVSVAAWVPTILDCARKDAALRAEIDRHVARRRTAAMAAKDTAPLEQHLRLFDGRPRAGEVRNALARKLIARRADQRAELLLLATRASGSRTEAANATALLCQLWTGHGLRDRAADMLSELSGRFANVKLSGGTTGRAFARQAMQSRLTAYAARRRAGPAFPVRRATIVEDRWRDPGDQTEQNYNQLRQLFPTAEDSPFDLVDLGTETDTRLTVLHRETGVITGHITIPSQHSYPILSRASHVGQFLSLGSAGRMHGLSLLELHRGKPFWTTAPQGFARRRDMITVGPAGPTFAAFQSGSTLAVVDPGTGRLLWQRDDLPPQSGLQSDPYTGLFGDERVLALFSAERSQCTVYRTRTGEIVRRQPFPLNASSHRELFGRFLFLIMSIGGKTRLRVWDPLTDRNVFDRTVAGRVHTAAIADEELAALLPDGRLLVLHVPTGRVTQQCALDESRIAGANYLKAFRDGKRLFVNVQRPVSVRDRFFSFYAGDAFGRIEHVRGELHAFDLQTGRRLWSRTMPQRTVVRPRSGELPVLVLVSRIRDRRRGTRVATLVEVLDAETGRLLGRRTDLFPDRVVHASYAPDLKAVVLRGLKHDVQIRLHRRAIVEDFNGSGPLEER